MHPNLPDDGAAAWRRSQPVPHLPAGRSRSRALRSLVVVAVGGLALVATACGGATSSTPTSIVAGSTVVRPPDVPLQGCDYVLNGSVPQGEPMGIQPDFRPFAPDQSAQSAIAHISAHGGTGLVYGFTLPSGVKLYAGPDAGGQPVATIPSGKSILAADPLLWTTGSGRHWIATFVACGGAAPDWISVDQIGKADPPTGTAVTQSITMLKSAAPYTQTGQASAFR